MKTTFRLTRPNSDKPTRIYIDIHHRGERTKFYTPQSILPAYWDQSKQQVKGHPHRTQQDATNALLSDIQSKIREFPLYCIRNNEEQSVEGLKVFLESHYARNPTKDYEYFTDYYREVYLSGIKSGAITYERNGQRLRYGKDTIRTKETFLRTVSEFERSKYRLKFDNINLKFYEDFRVWSEKKGHKPNYFGRLIKELKTIMRYTHEGGIHTNEEWKKKGFTTTTEEITSVALNEDELKRLQSLDLEGKQKHYRDTFLVGCYTALRFSDYSRLTPDHIKQRGDRLVIEITTKKTKASAIIPVADAIQDILMDPDYFNRKPNHPQKLNNAIKKLCKQALIDEPTEVTRIVDGEKKTKTVPKHELITTHTARRTGATNMYLAGIPTQAIMKITTHKTESSFLKYICIDKRQTAELLLDHKFFKSETT